MKLAAMHLYHDCGMDLELGPTGQKGQLGRMAEMYGVKNMRELADEYRFICNKAQGHVDVALWYVQCARQHSNSNSNSNFNFNFNPKSNSNLKPILMCQTMVSHERC